MWNYSVALKFDLSDENTLDAIKEIDLNDLSRTKSFNRSVKRFMVGSAIFAFGIGGFAVGKNVDGFQKKWVQKDAAEKGAATVVICALALGMAAWCQKDEKKADIIEYIKTNDPNRVSFKDTIKKADLTGMTLSI